MKYSPEQWVIIIKYNPIFMRRLDFSMPRANIMCPSMNRSLMWGLSTLFMMHDNQVFNFMHQRRDVICKKYYIKSISLEINKII